MSRGTLPEIDTELLTKLEGCEERIGYQFSTGDGFLGKPCKFKSFDDDSAMCSAPVGQLILVFSFYERVRIQGGVEWFPDFLPPMKSHGEGQWNGFIQVGWQWISPF